MINTSQIMGMIHPNTEVRTYHVRCKLMDRNGDQPALNDLLYLIPGITQVNATPYSFAVTKALMYQWDEIEPHIEELLGSYITNIQGMEKEK